MKFNDIKKEKVGSILCHGCLKAFEGTCTVYEKPSVWVTKGGCPMKTNKELDVESKKKINPIKRSKRRQ